MASIASAVFRHIAADPGVVALVGNRIYPDAIPQGHNVRTGGAVLVYVVISTIHDHLINGLAGIARSRIEFTAYAWKRDIADAVEMAVRRSGLAGFTGDMHGIEIESVMLDSGAQSLDEKPTDGTQSHRYLTVFDYLIAYQESA